MKGLENIRISRIRVAVMLFGIVILGIIFFKGQQEYPIAIAGESASETALAGSSSELQQYWQASAAAARTEVRFCMGVLFKVEMENRSMP